MAKQRQQPQSKPLTGSTIGRDDAVPDSVPPRLPAHAPLPVPAAGADSKTRHIEAVALYEQGLQALQRHHYNEALERLRSVLELYPGEKEVHERVRLYLNICERHATPHENRPQTVDERLYASTLALNGGKYDEAISQLRLVRDEDPDNDHALYMLAVAHAQRGEHAEAVAHLDRAIVLNPENRALARRDPDLEPLRDDDSFRSAVDLAPFAQDSDGRRPPVRPRSA